MRLFLVRHGQSTANVTNTTAGSTDSPLTPLGLQQATLLGQHFSKTIPKITHIFSSNLQRAFHTAEVIRTTQLHFLPPTTQHAELQERDHGSYESIPYRERPKRWRNEKEDAKRAKYENRPGFKDMESYKSMNTRTDSFVHEFLAPLLGDDGNCVVVVAHGTILGHLETSIKKLFPKGNVGDPARLNWVNTGFMEIEILDVKEGEEVGGSGGAKAKGLVKKQDYRHQISEDMALAGSGFKSETLSTPALLNKTFLVKSTNCKVHLQPLKKEKKKGGNKSKKPGVEEEEEEVIAKKEKDGESKSKEHGVEEEEEEVIAKKEKTGSKRRKRKVVKDDEVLSEKKSGEGN